MQTKGQIIGGNLQDISIRQKSSTPIELGELLVVTSGPTRMLLHVFGMEYGSQLSVQSRELLSGMSLEQSSEATAPVLYESELRNYLLAKACALVTLSDSQVSQAKSLPALFSSVREIQASDVAFLPKVGFCLGKLRSGSHVLDVDVHLPTEQVLSHHMLICATTGKGKSNLMSTLLYSLLLDGSCALLVFDPHDEYVGRSALGLSSHPQWHAKGVYYSITEYVGARSLKIQLGLLHPLHFLGVTDFSTPQLELLFLYYSAYGDEWIVALIEGRKLPHQFNEGTYAVVKRRLCRLLDLDVSPSGIVASGVYSLTQGETILRDIDEALTQAKTVLIDTSFLQGEAELLLCSVITRSVFDAQKWRKKKGQTCPIVSVVLEEAPRVIGKDVLEKGMNVFGTIAREGRKFGVGLVAITQLPSLIPKDILANMNTKIIMGLEMSLERAAVVESSTQDISRYDREIASLAKGEALVSSTFTRFALPIRIPLFSTIALPKQTRSLPGVSK